ncbi:MAG: hypothetical protein ACFB14_27980 [Leptolyngbyaceae cyanobacterium]
MHIAYLVTQHSNVSRTEVKDQLYNLEESGIEVSNYSIYSLQNECDESAHSPKPSDLETGPTISQTSLMGHLATTAFKRPIAWYKCYRRMLGLWVNSSSSLYLHFVYMAEACVLFNWANQNQVDHIHAHFGTDPSSVAMLCHVLGGPTYSFTIRGSEKVENLSDPLWLEKVKRAKFVAVIDETDTGDQQIQLLSVK